MNTAAPYVPPAHFPPGCPKPPHEGRPGRYVRLLSTREDPPDSDFLPQDDQAPLPGVVPKKPNCDRCALSVFVDAATAQDFLDAHGGNWAFPVKGWLEAEGDHGVIHPKEGRWPGHYLWWLPRSAGTRSFRKFFRGLVDDA